MYMIISDNQLKQLVLKNKITDEAGFAEVLQYAQNSNITLQDALIEKDLVSDENLGLMIADALKIPFIVLSKTSISTETLMTIPEKVARELKVIAFTKDQNGIKIAIADPTNTDFPQMLSKKTQQKISVYYATDSDIHNAFRIYRRDLQETFEGLIVKEVQAGDGIVVSAAPAGKVVDMMIDYAYQDKASDIHIEPEEKDSLVRFRIDGILHDVLRLPKTLHDQVVTRIKVQSRLRTDEHLSPQDGKLRMKLPEENLDIRVSIIPIVEGEKAVLRLLSSHSRQFSLQDLGMNERDLKKVTNAYNKSYGMILSTGPTGSGKTTSIYSILKILNVREKNITTIEDPVEYRIKGVNQIQANPKTNLTFAAGLRSVLRQDPNIIFVGEIRDSETAGIAVNAALTGHLVLSTLHTNDAATALPRLTDMKIEPFLVASTVNAIIGQRLVRKICEMCKTSLTITQTDLAKNLPADILKKNFGTKQEVRVYQGKGCKVCHATGYVGRIGVFEVLEATKSIRKLIAEKNDSDVISQAAVSEGMTTMLDDGLQKALQGLTTIEEVLRVTRVESL